jgi:pimeloyl-ACP methyl ester carboxylesterase
MPVAASLYYFVHEADNLARPPVILIHGAGGHHLFWPPQVRRMPDQRIFAVDLPGHGKSEGIGHHTIEDYTGEIMEFIKALNLNAVVMAGHSMGSAIALKAAILYPKQVLGLCLIGSGVRLRVARTTLQSISNPSTYADTVRLVINDSFSPQTDERLKDLATQRMEETRSSILYGDFLACDAFDITDQLSQISAPTFILCGALDKMVPLKYSKILRDNIPGSHMEVMPNAGHMLMLEDPDQTADKMSSFIDSIPYQPGL